MCDTKDAVIERAAQLAGSVRGIRPGSAGGKFMIVFASKFMSVVLGRMDANAEIYRAILDDQGFQDDLTTTYGRDLYHQLHGD